MIRSTYLLIPFVALAFLGCGPDEGGDNPYERPSQCQSLLNQGLIAGEGERDLVEYPFVERQ